MTAAVFNGRMRIASERREVTRCAFALGWW